VQPETWGDFEVYPDQVLGRGGMGSVYRGRQISLDRPVAIKVLKRELCEDPEFVKRFHREASLLARITHPNVLQIYAAGEHKGLQYFAMELLEGEDLSGYLRREYKFCRGEIFRIAIDTSSALDAAWRHKIIHRDIKPSNIFLTQDNQLKVMDFGLAKSSGAGDITMDQTILGTAKYMSPEQATNQPMDIRTDLYSLGAVLYEVSTGLPPFSGDNPTAIVYRHVHEAPAPPRSHNAELEADIEAMILKLLAKSPDQRFQSPEEVMEYSRAAVEGAAPELGLSIPVAPKKESVFSNIAPPAEEATDETVLVQAEEAQEQKKGSFVGMLLALLLGFGAVGAGGYFAWKRMKATPDPGAAKTVSAGDVGGGKKESSGGKGSGDASGGNTGERKGDKPIDKTKDKTEETNRNTSHETSGGKAYEEAVSRSEEAKKKGDWDTALRELDDAEKHVPEGDGRRAEIEAKRSAIRFERAHRVAEEAFGRKDWVAAIRSYEEATKELPERDERRTSISKKIAEAKFQIAWTEAEDRFAKKEWEEALRLTAEAGALLPEGDARSADVKKRTSAIRFERAFARGETAAGRKDWASAREAFEEALKELGEDDPRREGVVRKRDGAGLEVTLEEAAKERDLAKRVETYRACLGRDLSRIRPLLRSAAVQLAQQRMKAKEWAGAAEALKLAIENEPDAEARANLERRLAFCARVEAVLKAESAEEWIRAKELLVELLAGENYGMRAFLQERLKFVNEKLEAGMTGEDKRNRDLFLKLVAEARQAFDAGQWNEAHRKMEEASKDEYRPFHDEPFRRDRAHYSVAAKPPKGMVYVPGGKYVVGDSGDRTLHGPSWEVELKPYLIDIEEVSRRDYRDFLTYLNREGHKLCHADEPRGLTHLPERRATGDGPVNWVTWWDATAYAAFRKKRLPTETEFEVAAGYDPSSRSRRAYPWGDGYGSGGGESAFGLRGLDNDVLEWTSSDYQSYPGSQFSDTRFGSERKILRGGTRSTGEQRKQALKVTHRSYWLRGRGEMYTGFRCVMEIPEK